jgi:hypothetical protein
MLDPGVAYVNVTGIFPNVEGVNASGPSATDGFEFVANFVNDNNIGWMQMLLNLAGMTPNGVVESDSASQMKEAMRKTSIPPGVEVGWHQNVDPATAGYRLLLLNGQGILRANYPDLDTACYVGDGNNATASAYYRADDAAGTSRNIAGIYLILPETRGYVPRGLDVAASVDPDGASRDMGSLQTDAFQGHVHYNGIADESSTAFFVYGGTTNEMPGSATNTPVGDASARTYQGLTSVSKTDGVNGTPRISSETRMANYADVFAVGY